MRLRRLALCLLLVGAFEVLASAPFRAQSAEAIPKAREALAQREQALGANHPDVAASLQTLADLLRDTAQYAAGRRLQPGRRADHRRVALEGQ